MRKKILAHAFIVALAVLCAAVATAGRGTFTPISVVFEGIVNGAVLTLAALLVRRWSRSNLLFVLACVGCLALVEGPWERYTEGKQFANLLLSGVWSYAQAGFLRIGAALSAITAALALISRAVLGASIPRRDSYADRAPWQYSLREGMLWVTFVAVSLGTAGYARRWIAEMHPFAQAEISYWLDVGCLGCIASAGLWATQRTQRAALPIALAFAAAAYAACLPPYAALSIPERAYLAIGPMGEFRDASVRDVALLVERNIVSALLYIGILSSLGTTRFKTLTKVRQAGKPG